VLDKQKGRGQYTPITPSYASQRQSLSAWIKYNIDTKAFVSILLKKGLLENLREFIYLPADASLPAVFLRWQPYLDFE
jgi:hypothetical protein